MDSKVGICRVQRAIGRQFGMLALGAALAVLAGCGVVSSGSADETTLMSVEVAGTADGDVDSDPAESGAEDQSLAVEASEGDAESTNDVEATPAGSGFTVVFAGGTEDELPVTIEPPRGWSPGADNVFSDGASTIALTTGCADCDDPGGYNEFFTETDLEDEGFGFGIGDDGTVHESISGPDPDGSWFGQVALYLDGAPNFVGCTVDTADEVGLETLVDVCESMSIGWPPDLVEAAMEQFTFSTEDKSMEGDGEVPEIVETLTDAAAGIIADPVPELPRRDVLLEMGEESRSVNVALPAHATVGESFFGVEVSFGSSIFTDLELASTCDGACEPKDWKSVLNSADGYLTSQRSALDAIANDSPIESGWLLSGSGSFGDYTIVVARWDDASDQFMMCEASVDEDDLDLVNQMLGICLSAKPSWF